MPIHSLIYHSMVNPSKIDFSEEELIDLAERATKFNNSLQITGFITYKNGHFIQYLEGEANALNILMKKIKNDKRHEIEIALDLRTKEERLFANWGMKYLLPFEREVIDFNNLLSMHLNVSMFKSFGEEHVIRKINGTLKSFQTLLLY